MRWEAAAEGSFGASGTGKLNCLKLVTGVAKFSMSAYIPGHCPSMATAIIASLSTSMSSAAVSKDFGSGLVHVCVLRNMSG